MSRTLVKKLLHTGGRFATVPELVKLLNNADVPIQPLDASWFLPNVNRDGYQEFLKERIPKARFFDIDAVKDEQSPYPHMLPSKEVFDKSMGDLGIAKDVSNEKNANATTIVC